jgi:hypothetical protein
VTLLMSFRVATLYRSHLSKHRRVSAAQEVSE